MSSGLTKTDSLFSVRSTPWHGEGAVLKRHPKSIDEAIKLAGLDWDVIQKPVKVTIGNSTKMITDDDGKPIYFVNIRDDIDQPLGIVSKRYTPVQNRSAFSFLSAIFGSDMLFETAGSLMGGRRVWVMMKIPDYVEVGGDPIGQFAFISNSHDGKSSVLAAMTPIRIVCQNTLGAAVSRAKTGDAQRTYTIRHLGDMDAKISEARNVLDVTINYYEQFKKFGDKLALSKIGDKKALALLEKLMPVNPAQGDRAADNKEEARREVLAIFKGEGAHPETVGNAPGTVWALYNAATEYADWGREIRKSRFQRNIDDADGLKSRAWDLSLAAAGLN